MSQVNITLPDGSSRAVSAGTPVGELAAGISPRLAKAALAAIVNDHLVDLTYPLQQDATVRIVTPDNPEALPLYRHSTAHLLALDHGMRPLFASLGATVVANGVYGHDGQFRSGGPETALLERVDRAVEEAAALARATQPSASPLS